MYNADNKIIKGYIILTDLQENIMDYYDILKVGEYTEKKEIVTSYRTLVLIHHPDKGGDLDAFDKITKAYKVLSNDKCRSIYDNYGAEQANRYLNGDFTELNGIVQQYVSVQPKGTDKRIVIYITLEEFYHGALIYHIHERITWCDDCRGTGSASADNSTSLKKQKCTTCDGDGIQTMEEKINITIPPGACNKYKSIHQEMGDTTNPKTVPGSLIISIVQKPHSLFERNGNNLLVNVSITLEEALYGLTHTIKHLNGDIHIKENRLSDFVDMRYILSMGMPVFPGSSNQLSFTGTGVDPTHGNLIILYRVNFPNIPIPREAKPIMRILLGDEARVDSLHNNVKIYKTSKCLAEHVVNTKMNIELCRQM